MNDCGLSFSFFLKGKTSKRRKAAEKAALIYEVSWQSALLEDLGRVIFSLPTICAHAYLFFVFFCPRP